MHINMNIFQILLKTSKLDASKRISIKPIICLILTLFTFSCSSIYYSAWEKLGYQKRDLLKSSVESAQQEQKNANEQFKDALVTLRSAYNIKPTELQNTYDKLNGSYEASLSRSTNLGSRIDKMDQIAKALFVEWNSEARSMQNSNLKNNSLEQLEKTKEKYSKMYDALRNTQKGTDPILAKFRDYVLYLKHNLNAQSVGSLQIEASDIESGLEKLIADMNGSIKEAESFVNTLK